MKIFRYGFFAVMLGTALLFVNSGFAYMHTTIHSITWPGEKWEYLVEHPAKIHHIDLIQFEEILDTAGMHGWKLINMTDAFHFYTFYFVRPLLPHKLAAHIARLKRAKKYRAAKEAGVRYTIHESLKENPEIQQKLKGEKNKAFAAPAPMPTKINISDQGKKLDSTRALKSK